MDNNKKVVLITIGIGGNLHQIALTPDNCAMFFDSLLWHIAPEELVKHFDLFMEVGLSADHIADRFFLFKEEQLPTDCSEFVNKLLALIGYNPKWYEWQDFAVLLEKGASPGHILAGFLPEGDPNISEIVTAIDGGDAELFTEVIEQLDHGTEELFHRFIFNYHRFRAKHQAR